jgi:hypothetical protein
MSKKREYNPGDKIRINIKGQIYEGVVISAANWGDGLGAENWYIEFDRTKGGRGPGYGYWKQGDDGGTVENLSQPDPTLTPGWKMSDDLEGVTYNQPDYTHYVIVDSLDGTLIESGWSYESDAQDRKRDATEAGFVCRVYTKTGAKRAGLDPDNDRSWLHGALRGLDLEHPCTTAALPAWVRR